MSVTSKVFSGGASLSGKTRYFATRAPTTAMTSIEMASMINIWIHGFTTPMASSPRYVTSAVNAPSIRTSPCANWMTSMTPKKRVKPTATIA